MNGGGEREKGKGERVDSRKSAGSPLLPPLSLVDTLLEWYAARARDLPWRQTPGGGNHPDPYAVLVSEVMLQQTTVAAVRPYFQRWMARYPTVKALAEAPEEEVLRIWEGLGYYSRARNLHAAAGRILERFRGRVPDRVEDLLSLPGVGGYTAGAVASIAYGRREPAVDANVLRVMSRLLARPRDPLAPGRGWKGHLATALRRLLPEDRPGDVNQALMDLGSTVCRTKRPDCGACALTAWCRGFAAGDPEAWPPANRRPATLSITAAVAVILDRGRILVQRRPAGGLLAGMWEFPGGKPRDKGGGRRDGNTARRKGKTPNLETPEEAVVREVREETGLNVQVRKKLGEFTHAYTRFRVRLHVFVCDPDGGTLTRGDARWATLEELDRLPMPSVNRLILRTLRQGDGEGQNRPRSL